MKNCINISIKRDQVIIKIDEDAEQRDIIANLKKKMIELKNLYKDDKTPIFILMLSPFSVLKNISLPIQSVPKICIIEGL